MTQADGDQKNLGIVRVGNILAIPEVLAELGVDPSQVLAMARLDPDQFSRPNDFISYLAGAKLIDHCVKITGCDDFGLRVGMRRSAESVGLAGFAAINAATVREALQTFVASLRLTDTGTTLGLETKDGYASWSVIVPGVPAHDPIGDICLAISQNVMRRMCGPDWRAARVYLTGARRRDPQRYSQFFQAPISFGENRARLLFPEKILDRPVQNRDRHLHEVLSPLLSNAIEQAQRQFLSELIRVLRGQLFSGELTPARAAAALQISPRTLARRLAEDQATFTELAQQVRFEAAQSLLRSGKSLPGIAALLGYSDQTAFIRAFRHWSGKTPARWRLEN
jgi:AraC-like DNA-binding protein